MQHAHAEPDSPAPALFGTGSSDDLSAAALVILRAGARARAVADALEREAIAGVLIGEHALILYICGPARRYPVHHLPVEGGPIDGGQGGPDGIAPSAAVRVRAPGAKPFWSVTVAATDGSVDQLLKAVIVMGPSEKATLAAAARVAALMRASL